MAISLASLQRTSVPKPPRVIVYGSHGVGKTTLAAATEAPVFIRTEDGTGALDVDAFPLATSFDDVMEALVALATDDHAFRTVVIDSLDWLEPLIWQHTCRENGWSTIEAAGYGKGYVAALNIWRRYIDAINYLRDERGMTVFQIAHCTISRFDSPESEPYDRYHIKLHKSASALLQEHSDLVMFANYKISTVKSDLGFNKKAVRAVGQGDRVLYTAERPAFLAKNRYAMPDELPMDWAAVAQHVPFYTVKQGN